MNEQKNDTTREDSQNENKESLRSEADRKNEANKGSTPSATERVKSNAGDGLANEGTNVSYDSER